MNQPIGFVGLGIMGRPIVRNLCRAGLSLRVYDVNPDACAALEEYGAKRGTLCEIAETCDLIMLCLPNGKIVHSVLFDEDGLCGFLRPSCLVCDMSSVSTFEALLFSRELFRRSGASYVDSPVSGGEQKAISGKLTIMAGCTEEQFQQLTPYYCIIGEAFHRVGPVGQGCLAKLCNQIIVTANIAAICEATAFAEKHGLDLSLLFEILKIGSADSAMLESRMPKLIARNFSPGGAIHTHLKDVRNVLAEAEDVGVELPITRVMERLLEACQANGNGELDSSSMLLFYEKEFGVHLPGGAEQST